MVKLSWWNLYCCFWFTLPQFNVDKLPDPSGLGFLIYKVRKLMLILDVVGKMKTEIVRIPSAGLGTEQMQPSRWAYSSQYIQRMHRNPDPENQGLGHFYH